MNGRVDLGDGSLTFVGGQFAGKCGACHGQGDDPFPTTRAHPAHKDPKITTPVACGTCHTVTAMAGPPVDIKTPNHMNGKVELTFTGRALDRGSLPKWDGTSCSFVACHGANLPQAPFVAAPQWADPTHIPGACGACHQIPPTFLHTTSITCDSAGCHGPIVSLGPNNVPSITPLGKTLHINGTIDRY
jgi:predicted CxxxxCH...CXXCH cytochrome family protein